MLTTCPRETVSEKADRLNDNFRVILTGPSQAVVIGDHDTYEVARLGHWTCTCKWGRYRSRWSHCSHVLAVQRAMKEPSSQVPVARQPQLLTAKGGR